MSWIVADETSPLFSDITERCSKARGAGAAAARRTSGRASAVARCGVCGKRFGVRARFCPFDGEPLAPEAEVRVADPLLATELGGRYRVEHLVGEGGMGCVYQVTHVGLARSMAAKILRPELVAVGDLSARFLAEARAAALIEHPNVVRILDFGVLPAGRPYFVMELLGGRSLRSVMGGEPLHPARVVHIARQTAEGLGAAHAAGIVHRDLKPDNVHVDEDAGDFVKVLDFGLARIAGATRLTGRGVVFGTPQYMSPEQAAGEPLDGRTDIYALGVMMYEMLTGQVPFDAPTFMGVLQQHLHESARPVQRLLPGTDLGGLDVVVARCLSKRSANRFASMEEVIAALDECKSSARGSNTTVWDTEPLDSGPPAGPDGVGALRAEAPWSDRARFPFTVLALAGSGLAVGTLVASLWLGGSETPPPPAESSNPLLHVEPLRPAGRPAASATTSGAPQDAPSLAPSSSVHATGAAPPTSASAPEAPSFEASGPEASPPPSGPAGPRRAGPRRTPSGPMARGQRPLNSGAPRRAAAPSSYPGDIIDPWAEPREPVP